jgi:translocation and assembly module TamA
MLVAMRLLRRFACLACVLLLPVDTALGKVALKGLRGELRENALAHLELADAPCDSPSWRVRRLTKKADAQIREALEAYGYYNPSIAMESGSTSDCWLTTIAVAVGDPVRVRTLDVSLTGEAAQDAAFERLVLAGPLKQGDVLVHATYDRYKKAIGDLARRKGFFAGNFVAARIDVFAREDAADITIRYDSGPRYRFGAVTFEQDVVRQDLLERFVDFSPGEPYDGTKITNLYNALLATGYFASVDLRTQPGTLPDTLVPVTVQLTGASRQVWTAGIGYSTDTGVKLRGGFTNRRINDRGHQFDASMNLSEVTSDVGFSYRLPRKDPRVEWLSFDAGYSYEDTGSKTTNIYKVGVKEYQRRPNEWIETHFLDVGIERFDIADERQREFLLIPGVSWNRTMPNNASVMRPDKGHRLTLTLSGTADWLASDATFLQADLFGKLIFPLWKGARLLTRAQAGLTLKDEFEKLPASVRYFAGGDSSVRGYDFDSLGPTNETGEVIGGTHTVVGSVEIDQRVRSNWSVAAFVDTGNAFDSFASPSLKTGIGGGVRWFSPLGPVRVDIAFAQDKDAPDDWRLHVSLGPDL